MAGKKGGRAPASGAPQLSRRLREQLAQALGESAERAVAQVVARFEGELEAAAAPAAATAVKAAALDAQSDYDLYHACCVRLVRYIEANMETSAEFAQQMERIILACHSNASEHVLRSVVTKDLWFHRRQEGAVPRTDAPKDERAPAKAPFTLRSSQPPTPPPPPQPTMAPTATARTARAADKRRPAARTRSGSRDLSPPPKRPRRAAARIVVDSDSSEDENNVQQQVSDDNRDESEEEEEEEGEDAGGEEQEEKPAKGRKGKARSTQPHLEQGEERLLDFKDAIGELCYPENREPPQTKFFKDRLRRSILFVDAQLCKPPVGMFCSRDCKKLRAVMCNGDKPCKNKTCRIWHDVEVHTDRCENPQCEFKNRIMLRETMHKIDHCKQDLHRNRAELQAKRKHLVSTRRGEQNDREKFIEATLLENEITQLENDIEEGEEELGRLNGTRKAFWGILNDIGVKMSDDITDEFPDFDTHYTSRRPARKAKTAPKPKRESMSPPRPTTTPTRTTGRNLRSRGSGPHDENSASPATSARATRRSTRAISQDSDVQMIEVDEDEETKEEHSGDDEKDPVYELPDDGEDESEHEEHGPEAAASEVSELVENPTASERDTAANQEEAEVAEVVDIDLVVEPLSTESKGVSASVVASVTVESVIEEAAKELPRSQRASDVIGVENNGVSEDSIPQEIAPEESAPEAASPVNREERGSSFHEDEEENAFSAMNARWPGGL